MKIRFYYIFFALCTVILSCKKDNYDEPAATLSGRIVYKGEALNFEYNRVSYDTSPALVKPVLLAACLHRREHFHMFFLMGITNW